MEICKISNCTGCGACADACPKKCITIQHDTQGFYRSYVDDSLCVNCHRCAQICPANHSNKPNRIQKTYKARRTDNRAAAYSSSGGIASTVSEYIVGLGGVVAGCGYDESLCLKHSIASRVDELEKFKGSKYLQSNTSGIYHQVQKQLQIGKVVLFTGTPCQVSALHNYLGRDYDNLYTLDFVCHGVFSQRVFDMYLESLNKRTAPVSVRFRNKEQGYSNKKACFALRIEYPDEIISSSLESGIYYWFSSSVSVRESCLNCPFVSTERASDLTLADYIGKDMDDLDNEIGVNTLFVNSEKGIALLDAVKHTIWLEQKNTDSMAKLYDRLTVGSRKPACRKAFFRDLACCDYITMVEKYDANRVLPNKNARRLYAAARRFRKLFIKT